MENTATAPLVDIDQPIVLLSFMSDEGDAYTIGVSDVLYHNSQVCMVELDDDGPMPYALIDRANHLCIYNGAKYHVTNEKTTQKDVTVSQRARAYASRAHRHINQLYDGRPYMFHVDMAAHFAQMFIHLVPEEDRENTLAAVYLHDVSEDAHHVTYNDLKEEFGEIIADIAFALANEKGKTRDERANDKYYREMREVPNAVFGKLCDRIANMTHGIDSGGSMLKRYRKEYPKFKAALYDPKYDELFAYIEEMLGQ